MPRDSEKEVSLEAATTEEAQSENVLLVDWDGPDDESNPCNWPSRKRWTHIILVATLALIPNLATTMVAPGIEAVLSDFEADSTTLQSLSVTIFLLGLALGPMFLAPLGEFFGRLPVYHAANITFTAFMLGTGLSTNIAGFMVFRFLAGCAGGMPLNMGGGTIADVTPPADRGFATALFSLGPLAGPVLGPVIGGFLTASNGWRWTSWLLVILGGAGEMATIVIMRETSPRILLERKAARLRAATGNMRLKSRLAHTLSRRQAITQSLTRPTMLLFKSPVVLALSLYVALVFGIVYILFTTFTSVFRGQYGFSSSIVGLVYLPFGFALVLGVVVFAKMNPLIQAARMKADGVSIPKPEYRLLLMVWLSPCVPIGLFIYGWTTNYKADWIVPIIGSSIVGFGGYFVLMPTQLYLIELFGSKGAASALSANNVFRYMGGTFLPLAGPWLYGSLGYGWGNTLLGFLALLFIIPPTLLYKFGDRLRANEALTH